jgi:hypothetical protein
MSTRSVEIVVLCEDLQQEVFVRHFLRRRGREQFLFRPRISPAGRGSGEQWVRERFPRELKAYRSQATRRDNWLLVVTDADTGTVQDRISGLARACEQAGVPFREPGEKVVFVIPRRNIETWFAYLRAEVVNETGTYPRHECETDCRPEVRRLDEMCTQGRLEPNPPPQSLVAACEEFQRVKG